jgi:hypothetical protein
MRKYMTVIRKPRRSRGLKSMSAAAVAGASVVGLVLGTGTANAGVDASNTVVDADGNSITINLEDTFVNSVFPLDGNPLTREFFGNGRITYNVSGPTADDFEGTVKVGYQVGYPGSLGGEFTLSYSTPQLEIGDGDAFTVSDILPQAAATATIAPGPGIIQAEGAIATVNGSADITGGEQDASGTSGSVQVANVHGTATGILGNVRVRPYASLTSATGDTVVTYGAPWVFN